MLRVPNATVLNALVAVDCSFSNNSFTLNVSNVVTNTSLDGYPFTYNTGIAASYGSGNYFSNNTFTVSASNTVNGYYGIALNQMFLDANFDNFTNNIFTNGGLGVFAEGYGPTFSSNFPNNMSNQFIETTIATNNSWH